MVGSFDPTYGHQTSTGSVGGQYLCPHQRWWHSLGRESCCCDGALLAQGGGGGARGGFGGFSGEDGHVFNVDPAAGGANGGDGGAGLGKTPGTFRVGENAWHLSGWHLSGLASASNARLGERLAPFGLASKCSVRL